MWESGLSLSLVCRARVGVRRPSVSLSHSSSNALNSSIRLVLNSISCTNAIAAPPRSASSSPYACCMRPAWGGSGAQGRAPLCGLSEMITVMVMRSGARAVMAGAGIAVLSLLGAAAPGTGAGAAGGAASPDVVRVVAGENFWGSVAAQIGGRDATVTSIISNPNADPHLFETDAADAATLARAQVAIENGAGYDPWMRSLLSADGGSARVVNVASILHVGGSNPNPHLWYAV